jgi:hypothetical protein
MRVQVSSESAGKDQSSGYRGAFKFLRSHTVLCSDFGSGFG